MSFYTAEPPCLYDNLYYKQLIKQIENEKQLIEIIEQTFKQNDDIKFTDMQIEQIKKLIYSRIKKNSYSIDNIMNIINIIKQQQMMLYEYDHCKMMLIGCKPYLFGTTCTSPFINKVIEECSIFNFNVEQTLPHEMINIICLIQQLPQDVNDIIINMLGFSKIKVIFQINNKDVPRYRYIHISECKFGEICPIKHHVYYDDFDKLIKDTNIHILSHYAEKGDYDMVYIVEPGFTKETYKANAMNFGLNMNVKMNNTNAHKYNKKYNKNLNKSCNIVVYELSGYINDKYKDIDMVFSTREVFESNNSNIISTLYYDTEHNCFKSVSNVHPLIAILHAIYGIDSFFSEWLENDISKTRRGVLRQEKLKSRIKFIDSVKDTSRLKSIASYPKLIEMMEQDGISFGIPIFQNSVDAQILELVKNISIDTLRDMINQYKK